MSITENRPEGSDKAGTSRFQVVPDVANVAHLVGQFETSLRDTLDYDSFEYSYPEHAIHLCKGRLQRHRCGYGLRVAERQRGEVILTRKTPFKESELQSYEKCLAGLAQQLCAC